MPAISRSSGPSTRNTGSCFTSCFSCMLTLAYLGYARTLLGAVCRHQVARLRRLHVWLDVEKISGALGDPLEHRRGHLSTIVAGLLQRLVHEHRYTELRLLSGKEAN